MLVCFEFSFVVSQKRTRIDKNSILEKKREKRERESEKKRIEIRWNLFNKNRWERERENEAFKKKCLKQWTQIDIWTTKTTKN